MDISKNPLQQQYPSVELAYEIALHSYDVSMQRLDAANANFDKLRSWITTVNLAFFAWALSKEPNTAFDCVFYLGLAIFVTIVVLTMHGKSKDGVLLPDPMLLYKTRLHEDHWTFKKNFVYIAGLDFDENRKFVNKKGRYQIAIFSLLLLEAEVMGIWLGWSPLQR